MPSSWPQPAVLANLLASSTSTAGPDGNKGKNDSGTSSTASPTVYDHRVLALYKFVSPKIPKGSLPDLKKELETICRQHNARGTFLIAEEGINGTICYPFQQSSSLTTTTKEKSDGIKSSDGSSDDDDNKNNDVEVSSTKKDDEDEDDDELLSLLQDKFDRSLRIRISVADRPVFSRLKIRIKSEIVTMHWKGDKQCDNNDETTSTASCSKNDDDDDDDTIQNGINDESTSSSSPPSCGPCCPTERVGEYVRPRDWNKLLLDPDTLVIDTRNEYEIDVGTFRNAVNPHTQSFVEFPDWMNRNIINVNNNDVDDEDDDDDEKAPAKKKKIAMFCE